MIIKANFAGLNIRIDNDWEMKTPVLDKFRYDFRCEPDVLISVTLEEVKAYCTKNKTTKEEACERIAFDKFGALVVRYGGVCVRGKKSVKDGKRVLELRPESLEGNWYVLRKNRDDELALYTTPWSFWENASEAIDEIIIEQTGPEEVSEPEFLKAMLLTTKRPHGEENFGKYVGILGAVYRELKIKRWHSTES